MLIFAEFPTRRIRLPSDSRSRFPTMSIPLDVRYGFRKLNNNAGFTIVAVACLALGICASVTVFSVVDALLLRPFPGVARPGPDRLPGQQAAAISGLSGEAYAPALNYPAFQRYRSSEPRLHRPGGLSSAAAQSGGDRRAAAGERAGGDRQLFPGPRPRRAPWGGCSSPAREGARRSRRRSSAMASGGASSAAAGRCSAARSA